MQEWEETLEELEWEVHVEVIINRSELLHITNNNRMLLGIKMYL